MFEIMAAVHRALGFESRWPFLLIVGATFAFIGVLVAWTIDTNYWKSPEYLALHAGKATELEQPTNAPLSKRAN